MGFFSKQAGSTDKLAVSSQGKRLDVVGIERNRNGRPRVTRCESYPVDGGLTATLSRLRQGGKLGSHCLAMLAPGEYQFLTIEALALPDSTPRAELNEAVRWKIKDMVDFPVTAASVGALPIPAQPGRPGQLFALAASHAVIKPLIESYAEAKLGLDAITAPEIAQRNLARQFETPDRALALLSFSTGSGLLTLSCNGELYATRRIDTGAAELATDKSLYERVVLDVQRTLDNFDRNFSHLSLQRLLVLPVPAADDFIAHLKDNLYQPVEALNINDGLDISATPMLANAATLADAWLLLGAALEIGQDAAHRLDLFDPALQPQNDPWISRNLGLGVAASLLLCAIGAGWTHWQQAQAAGALRELEPQLQQARDETKQLGQQISGYKPSVDLLQELESGRLRLQARTEVLALLKKGLTSQTDNPAEWLRGLARQVPSGLWLTGFSINADNGALQIHGRTTDPKLIPEYVRRLNSENTFKGRTFAALEISKPAEKPSTGNTTAGGPAVAAPAPAQPAGVTPPPVRFHEFALSSSPLENKGGAS
jgi:MSHA biogenesis protein MshI